MSAAAQQSTARIRLHYRRLGLTQGWTRDRFYRLCQVLHCTPLELATLCCVSDARLRGWLKRNRFPPYVSLHFVLIEGAYLQATCGLRPQTPVVPLHLLPPSHD